MSDISVCSYGMVPVQLYSLVVTAQRLAAIAIRVGLGTPFLVRGMVFVAVVAEFEKALFWDILEVEELLGLC